MNAADGVTVEDNFNEDDDEDEEDNEVEEEEEQQGVVRCADVACGAGFTVAVTRSGRVCSWGAWQYGRLVSVCMYVLFVV